MKEVRSMFDNYAFTRLDQHGELLQEINALESRMAQTLGEDVRLIAYSPAKSDVEGKPQQR
jgi:hypothetical protein